MPHSYCTRVRVNVLTTAALWLGLPVMTPAQDIESLPKLRQPVRFDGVPDEAAWTQQACG